ncbi:hypothetical protein ACSETC_31125 [Pseudomonas aeruginosa]|uniref:hypothetical protein n=1 Tax=Pseudomonas aeruginosa TaxID=287 RepID=UPI001A2535DB|nr:hypothetical protein [Pseudomonas aeruginosa]MBH3778900.1 hypothetical protein [Pseudomonas aeruginosa]HBO4323160.1 hypothetical protein [Pseudomonas aeruginosa]HCC6601225.1 hypothetical protein [Pseudomonas aeruginosa]HCF7079947.1 hypothetical protein [Pseudomonas aeruginosa]
MSKEHSRYPYTYASDYIRNVAGYGEGGTKLSRSDASQILNSISEIIGMPKEEMARKLADYYLENQEAISEQAAKELAAAIFPNFR